MFPDRTDPETKPLFSRNPSDTCVAHLTGIERQAEDSLPPPNAPRETTMSMFESLGRYGVAIKIAHDRKKSIRALNSLPAHVQKDIGWPASPPNDPQAALASLLLGTPR
jgi:hypothetical protein